MPAYKMPLSVEHQQQISDAASPFDVPALLDLVRVAQDTLSGLRDRAAELLETKPPKTTDLLDFARDLKIMIDRVCPKPAEVAPAATDLDKIVAACHTAFGTFPGVSVTAVVGGKFEVILENGDLLTVEVEDTSVDYDDRGQGIKNLAKSKKYAGKAGVPTDHTGVLTACLCALTRTDLASRVSDLTTDGDNKDCEAIFTIDAADDYVIRVK